MDVVKEDMQRVTEEDEKKNQRLFKIKHYN